LKFHKNIKYGQLLQVFCLINLF